MPSITDILTSLFKGAGQSNEDAQATAAKLAVHPDAEKAISPFDVSTSDNTVTQNGNMSPPSTEMPFQMSGGPPSGPLQPEVPNPVAATPAPTTQAPTPITPPVTSAPSVPVVPPAKTPDAMATAITAPSNDNAAREAELARLEHQKRMNIIPAAIGGLGDAAAKGLSAFGMKLPSDTQNQILERGKETEEEGKKDFELKMQNDPNSDISKSYRQMVLQIAPTLAQQPNFQNMSAKAIGDKLPLIDTMMKAQQAKDMKEMSLAQMKSNKDISLGLREDQQQDKLEQQYKQQLTSVRGDPNISGLEKQRDGAAQAYNILAQSKKPDGSYDLSEPQLTELYNQITVATSGKGMTDSMQKSMDQATAKQKMASIATFIGMSPSATTQAIGDRLMHMSQVLGTQTQANLDKRMESRVLPPSGLKPERAKPIQDAGRGYSFQELVKKSNERKAGTSNTAGLEDKKAALRQKLGL